MKNKAKHTKKGHVRIISSARAISKIELSQAITTLETWGYEVSLGKNIFKIHHQFAGSSKERASDLQAAIDDASVTAILFARGGYGTVKMVDLVDFSPLKNTYKPLIGYSDITVIHSHLHQRGIPTIHGTMPVNFEKNTAKALESLKNCLESETHNIKANHHVFNRVGVAKGSIVGGNLSIIYSLMGSPTDLQTEGKILLIEDLDEYLYHIDRMMMNLKRSGKLDKLSGLIVGSFSAMNDNNIPFGKTALEIILEAVKEYDYPVGFDFPIGHIDDNQSLYLGVDSILEVSKERSNISQDLSTRSKRNIRA